MRGWTLNDLRKLDVKYAQEGERGTTVVYADRFVPDDEKRRAGDTGEEAQAFRS